LADSPNGGRREISWAPWLPPPRGGAILPRAGPVLVSPPPTAREKRADDGRAVMAFAFTPRRRARRVFAYWRSEQRTLRQGFVALLISSGGDLLAGLALAFMSHRLDQLPGLFVLIPAAIGMRGNIFG